MARTQNVAPVEATQEDIEQARAENISQWEFMGQSPTRPEVLDLLTKHRDQWGIEYQQYADFVQGLPSTKKLSRKSNGRTVEAYVDNWTLYVSVAGRLAMLQQLAEDKGWRIDFVPEPVTPTGIPGILQMDDQRLVYREYLVIYDEEGMQLGSKPGTAWVPYSGGKQAAGSNPYEKVETSARGRAIAAWGIGILPGSGIASVEEMKQILDNKEGIRPRQEDERETTSRADLLSQVKTLMEECRQLEQMHDAQMEERIGTYCLTTLGRAEAYPADEGGARTLNLDGLLTGQLTILANTIKARIKNVRAQESLA